MLTKEFYGSKTGLKHFFETMEFIPSEYDLIKMFLDKCLETSGVISGETKTCSTLVFRTFILGREKSLSRSVFCADSEYGIRFLKSQWQ